MAKPWSSRLRWAVPAVVAMGVTAAAITSSNGAGASEQPKLPPLSPAQLLSAVEHARPTNLSGTIVETANLGLPSLPGGDVAGGDGLSPQSLLTGSHTMRIWYGGPSQQRIALLAPMSERDVIHNGKDLWSYTSTTNQVTHATIAKPTLPSAPHLEGATPQQATQQALRAVGPTTRVKVVSTARIAGRAAYQLELRPRDPRSLIGSVRIAVDAATSTPLQVQIFASGASSPAIQVGFTDISFSTPRPSLFDFVPPAGATVAKQTTGSRPAVKPDASQLAREAAHGSNHPELLGNGWTAVVELPSANGIIGANQELLKSLSTSVASGRLITTPLLSLLLTKDGHVFAGPVSGVNLQRVAATGHGL